LGLPPLVFPRGVIGLDAGDGFLDAHDLSQDAGDQNVPLFAAGVGGDGYCLHAGIYLPEALVMEKAQTVSPAALCFRPVRQLALMQIEHPAPSVLQFQQLTGVVCGLCLHHDLGHTPFRQLHRGLIRVHRITPSKTACLEV
jgi:hypothetical protein